MDKILAIDLDEVIFDYAGGLREMMRKEGLAVSNEQPSSYSLAEAGWFSTVEDYVEFHAMCVEKYKLYSLLEPLEGASKSMWQLANEGFMLNIITSRFVKPGQHQMVVSQTVEALDRHKIPYANISFLSNKVLQFAECYVDDSPNNCERLAEADRFVLKKVMRYNEDSPGIPVNNWNEILEKIHERFDK